MRFVSTLGLIAVAAAASYPNLYDKEGADWPSKSGWDRCGFPGQSPIDLKNDFKKVYINNDLQLSNYRSGWTTGYYLWDAKHAVQYQAKRTGSANAYSYPINEDMALSSQYGARLGFSTMWNPW